MTPYKKYDQYKDSGVEWLGEVPEHWETQRLGMLFNLITTKSDDAYVQLGLEHIESVTGFIIGEESSYQGSGIAFQPNDILFGKLRPYLRKVALVEKHGAAVGDFYVVRSQKNVSPRYLRYRLIADSSIEPLNAFTYGAKMPRVGWEDFRNLEASRPPLPEQRAIADFLDRETAKIDALIEKKEKLIELLDEKRQALISHAVTKGLNPDAPMKDSGVPWLGEVPAHWEVKKLKYTISKTGSGTTPAKDDDYVESGGIPWVTTSELRETTIVETKKQVSHDAQRTYAPLVIHPKRSLLIAMYGATVGRLGRLGIAATSNQACFAIHPDQTNSIDYLELWFRAYRQEIIFLSIGAGQPNISGGILRNLVVPIPPIDERQTIITIVNKAVQTITKTQNHVSQSITLLREKRSALITAAVTGQIDVRGEVA